MQGVVKKKKTKRTRKSQERKQQKQLLSRTGREQDDLLVTHKTRYADNRATGRINEDHMLIDKTIGPKRRQGSFLLFFVVFSLQMFEKPTHNPGKNVAAPIAKYGMEDEQKQRLGRDVSTRRVDPGLTIMTILL